MFVLLGGEYLTVVTFVCCASNLWGIHIVSMFTLLDKFLYRPQATESYHPEMMETMPVRRMRPPCTHSHCENGWPATYTLAVLGLDYYRMILSDSEGRSRTAHDTCVASSAGRLNSSTALIQCMWIALQARWSVRNEPPSCRREI